MGKIVLEDFNGGEGFYKVHLDYLNKKQVEEIEVLVSKWKPTEEDIKSCIAMCLTDANEQRFKDYGTTLKDCLAYLEKQGKSKFKQCIQEGDNIVTNEDGTHFNISQLERVSQKVTDTKETAKEFLKSAKIMDENGELADEYRLEPKFKVGDWIISNDVHEDYRICKIIGIEEEKYSIESIYGYKFYDDFEDFDKKYHLWTIQDAKDGDVLATEDKNFTTSFVAIYKSLGDIVYNNITFNSHCLIGFDGNFYTGEEGHVIEGIYPATKEQRDLLFQKMKEAGYEWDAEKKELRKVKQKPTWSKEDEKTLNRIRAIVRNDDLSRVEDTLWLKSLKGRMKGE